MYQNIVASMLANINQLCSHVANEQNSSDNDHDLFSVQDDFYVGTQECSHIQKCPIHWRTFIKNFQIEFYNIAEFF